MMLRLLFAACGLMLLIVPDVALAWGYEGHRVVGSIADKLLANSNAARQVKNVLNNGDDPDSKHDLRLAGPWPDCVKSVVRHDDGKFRYEVDPEHLEYEVPCTPFNSKRERARMEDYVKRNWTQCSYKPDGFERGCHNTYHFDDVAIQRDRFDRSFQGTNEHDLIAAIQAAIAVLQEKPIPGSFQFSFKDKKEALLVLTHYIGDLHQPLHVGSVYLDENGKLVDPDVVHQVNPDNETIGGNAILDENRLNLHRFWDEIPTDLGDASTKELVRVAGALPPTPGNVEDWPVAWATESLLLARTAFDDLSFEQTKRPPDPKWSVSFNDHMAYLRKIDTIKREQLAKAGARLAAILNAIWP
jgi:hypothetical protein